MATFAAIIGSQPQTRQAFADAVERHFNRHYDDPVHRVDLAGLECRWWACRSAPVSTAQRGPWRVWVLGNVDKTDIRRQSHAERIVAHLEEKGTAGLACYSGCFVALVHSGADYYVVTDRLGLFPCYYAVPGEGLVLGSSSLVPVLHPALPRRLNFKGLLGYLLLIHEVLGESLWQGSHRLGVGEILHFGPGGLETTQESSLPVSDALYGLPPEAQMERADAAMGEAFEQYRDRSVSILFSGGLDSRLIAGHLGLSGAHVDAAYTFGLPSDLEFRCAHNVCRALHWRHTLVPFGPALFPALADRQIEVEQLANGISNMPAWNFATEFTQAAPPLINGFLGDPTLGGTALTWAYDPAGQRYSFDMLFRQNNAWGLSPEALARLFPGAETPRLVAEIIGQLRDLYESLPGYDSQKAWQFMFLNSLRFHIGGILRRIAHTVWPSAPYTHDAILTVAGGLPAAAVANRRLEKDLLAAKFPKLAALPLDVNCPIPRPLLPSLGFRVWNRLKWAPGARRLQLCRGERRYYYRMYDINNVGWRQLRQEGSRTYARLSGLLDTDYLCSLLPEPSVRIEVQDAIINAGGRRALLAFALWHKRYADVLS